MVRHDQQPRRGGAAHDDDAHHLSARGGGPSRVKTSSPHARGLVPKLLALASRGGSQAALGS
eukprot:5246315-Prymnesium_polylepis.1